MFVRFLLSMDRQLQEVLSASKDSRRWYLENQSNQGKISSGSTDFLPKSISYRNKFRTKTYFLPFLFRTKPVFIRNLFWYETRGSHENLKSRKTHLSASSSVALAQFDIVDPDCITARLKSGHDFGEIKCILKVRNKSGFIFDPVITRRNYHDRI